jgi:hypothetical protein
MAGPLKYKAGFRLLYESLQLKKNLKQTLEISLSGRRSAEI